MDGSLVLCCEPPEEEATFPTPLARAPPTSKCDLDLPATTTVKAGAPDALDLFLESKKAAKASPKPAPLRMMASMRQSSKCDLDLFMDGKAAPTTVGKSASEAALRPSESDGKTPNPRPCCCVVA